MSEISISGADYNTSALTKPSEVQSLLETYKFKIEDLDAVLNKRKVELKKAENRSGDIVEDIAELTADITAKENELTGYVEGSDKWIEADFDLRSLKLQLEKLQHRQTKNGSTNPVNLLERNMDNIALMTDLEAYKQFVAALELRQTELGG